MVPTFTSNTRETKAVSFYIELEADASSSWVYSIKPVKMTSRSKPLIRKPNNKVVKVKLNVPTSQFLDSTPEVVIDVPVEALTGFSGEAEGAQ